MSITAQPFQIKVTNVNELRMGSPYNSCEIEIIGSDKIQLPKYGWNDRYAWSGDNKTLVLIRWDIISNYPGFRFFIIDTTSGSVRQSERLSGLVNDLLLDGDKIKYNRFLVDREKRTVGEHCCTSAEVYIMTEAAYIHLTNNKFL